MAFLDDLYQARTRWDAAELLLRTWHARPAGTVDWRNQHERDFHDVRGRAQAAFDQQDDGVHLSDADRQVIRELTADGTHPQHVDAVGHGLGDSASSTYAKSWMKRLDCDEVTLSTGDVIPNSTVEWPHLSDAKHTSLKPSMGLPVDDHPHARLLAPSPITVTVSFAFWSRLDRILSSVINGDGRVAALAPNQGWDEIEQRTGSQAFPVRPVDVEDQGARVMALLQRAFDHDARIIVLPELASHPSFVPKIAEALDRSSNRGRLVVCGSWHDDTTGRRKNICEAVLTKSPTRIRHEKLTQITVGDSDQGWTFEGLDLPDHPHLTVYASESWLLAIVICKDAMDATVEAVLSNLGVNALLVPAMSRTTHPFRNTASNHIHDAQALVAVANGPIDWTNGPERRHALLGRPYDPGDLLTGETATAPALTIFDVRSGDTVTEVFDGL